MKLSKRERFLIGLVLLILIWMLAFRFFIMPEYAGLKQDRTLLWKMQGEKQKMDLYLEHFPDLEERLEETEDTDGFFYRGIDDGFIDRDLQAAAGRAGVDIRRMDIEEPSGLEVQTDAAVPPSMEHGIMESVVTMEVKSGDVRNMMEFADELCQESKSLVVSYMDVKAEYEKGLSGRDEYKGMSGIMEVRYYYETIK